MVVRALAATGIVQAAEKIQPDHWHGLRCQRRYRCSSSTTWLMATPDSAGATRSSWSVLTSSAAQPVTPSGPARAALIVKAEQGEAPAASDSAVHPRSQCPYSALHGRLRLELGPDVRPRQDHEGLHDLPKLCHCLHNLYPPEIRFAIVFDNFSSRHSTRCALGMGDWADVNNVELTGMRIHANRMNLMEGQFQALRYFTLDDTDHHSHGEQKVGCLALQPPPPPHRNEVAGEVATHFAALFWLRLCRRC